MSTFSTVSTVSIDEVTIPANLAEPHAADFIAAVDVGNTVDAIGFGTSDVSYEPAEELPVFLNPHQPKRMLVTQVLPGFRLRGIGTALADAVEALAASDGKKKALVYTPIAASSQRQLPSPTGFGSVDADHADTRFLLKRGYRLEQVERASRLTLPVGEPRGAGRCLDRRADYRSR